MQKVPKYGVFSGPDVDTFHAVIYLDINAGYRKILKIPPIITFQMYVSLKQIIVTNIIRNNKKYLKLASYFSKESVSSVTVQAPCVVNR